jgi:hypothetical protein
LERLNAAGRLPALREVSSVPEGSNSISMLQAESAVAAKPARLWTPEERLQAIEVLLGIRAAMAAGQRPVFFSASGSEITKWEELLSERASQLKVSVGALRNWYTRYIREGFDGLKPRPRSDRGAFKKFSECPLAAVLVWKWFRQGLRPAAVHRALVQEWPHLCPGSRPPTYPTVHGFLRSMFPTACKRLKKRAEAKS